MKIDLKKKIKNAKEFIISIIYFFRQSGKFLSKTKSTQLGGNLDPFYLAGVLEIYDRIKNKKITANFLLITIPLVFYAILQLLVIKEIVISKLIINVAKIIICILTMLYVKEHIKEIDIYKVAKISTVFMGIFLVISLILKDNDILWRFNDLVNKYNTTRLQFTYLEPSELGFHVSILLIILISYLFIVKSKREIIINIICIATNLLVLYFARPFGSIVILAVAIVAMFFWNLIKRFNKKKLILYFFLLIIGLMLIVLMYYFKSPIIMRAIDTINGKDSSNNYRVNLSLEILATSFKDYNYMGCGFGNLNTNNFRLAHTGSGIAEVLANSFIYFIIEGGIFSVVFLLVLISYLIKHAFKEYSLVKVGLLVFLVAYQIFGGHFTSGLTWALYGIIISTWTENSTSLNMKEDEKK